MSDRVKMRVFEQDNGARVVIPTTTAVPDELADAYGEARATMLERATGGAFSARTRPAPAPRRQRSWLPSIRLTKTRPARTDRPTLRKAPGTEATGKAMVLGAGAFLACVVFYNAFIITTGLVFRPLTIGCGALIGMGVKAGNKRRFQATNMLYAGVLAYLCVASTYVYWFYDEIMHPELYMTVDAVAVADMMGSVWGGTGGWEPDIPEAPGPIEGLWTACLKSLLFPFVLLQYGNVYQIVWGMMAVGVAWKTAAPRPDAG
ncbi:MAG: hypothetical protein H6732_12085 [Alphaproteobacteria bacterium]|nr:hypothetical protein [Alphaproteobacteria bacterium]